MSIQDLIALIIVSLPWFRMLIFDQEKLHFKKYFFCYLIASVISLVLGVLYFELSSTEEKYLVYFASCMSLIFLLVYNVIALPFRRKIKRNPEISQSSNSIVDIVATIIIVLATIVIPLLLDVYVIHYAIK